MAAYLARDLIISYICAALKKAKLEKIEISRKNFVIELTAKYNISTTTANNYINTAIYRLRAIGINVDNLQ